MKRSLLIFAISLFFFSSYAQNGQVIYKDGIYLSNNQLVTNVPMLALDLSIMKYIQGTYMDVGIVKQLNTYGFRTKISFQDIWAIVIEGVPYKTIYQYKRPQPYGIYPLVIGKSQYLLLKFTSIGSITCYSDLNKSFIVKAFDTRKHKKAKPKNLGMMIKDDEELYHEFVSRKNKKSVLIFYVNKYNERNPMILSSP
ncbi:MAG: hypothetical protein OCD76_02685 [Reichenbachiella sp.]